MKYISHNKSYYKIYTHVHNFNKSALPNTALMMICMKKVIHMALFIANFICVLAYSKQFQIALFEFCFNHVFMLNTKTT